MPDNPARRGPEDPKRINIHQAYEVAYWSTKFGVSEAKLRQAVSAVGVMVVDVERWLQNNR